MLFQTQFFILVFLPCGLAAYYLAARSVAARQWVLLAVSLVFYGWWDARFIPLLVGQVCATWLISQWHARAGTNSILYLGVALNLASLMTFKYLDFLIASLEAITQVALPRSDVVLPIGISFFSFQLISYLVDRMRGDAPVYPLRPFALFVMVFPHLIAGPIVRHNELIPQFSRHPSLAEMWPKFGAGFIIFTMGFTKKVLLADHLGTIVDPLFARAEIAALSFSEAWTATLGFTFQLFLDFSAYTEMAIGTALLFNLVLPENFVRPYLATSLRDFWRRWHITLSNFLRDYLYIPLGGSRNGPARYAAATLVTMGLCGLWHGAGWTFVGWGLWHGIGLIVCRGWQSLQRPLPAVAGWALTMVFIVVGWVLFRAHSFPVAASILKSLGGGGQISPPDVSTGLLFAVSALACVALPSAHELKDRLLSPQPLIAATAAVMAAICTIVVGTGAPAAFIYFQF